MIKVCDAIMGTGKSSAAITYMNEHKDDKFIYVTPYLEEATRIKKECPKLKFIEPSKKVEEFHFKKCEHTAALIKEGRNITTTHQAFKRYSNEMLDDIRRHGYRLIIDENVEVLERYDCHTDDIDLLISAGYMEYDDGHYTIVKDDYHGRAFKSLIQFMKTRQLIRVGQTPDGGEIESLFYWLFPKDLITAFRDVFILTYLFEGQSMYHFLKIHDLPYEYIGVRKREDGKFQFCEKPEYIPEYTTRLKDMIHIVDNPRMNSIGDKYHDLSMSWYERKPEGVEQLQKNVYNFMNNIWRGVPNNEKMWGGFKSYEHRVRGKGYTKAFITFNIKATNAYRNRKYLAYVVNLFMNVGDKIFYQQYGLDIDEDTYALSIMLQWIWRSAIRDGEEIYLYIPSKRMRKLLTDWIKEVSSESEERMAS